MKSAERKPSAREQWRAYIEESIKREADPGIDLDDIPQGKMDQKHLRLLIKLQCFRQKWPVIPTKEGIR